MVEVVSDCSFVVRNFEVSHGAPASFYAGKKQVSDWEVSTNITGSDITVELFDGLLWADLQTLTLRSNEGVNMGVVTVVEPGAHTIRGEDLPFLEHCIQLNDFLHLRYTVTDTHIDIGLEGVVPGQRYNPSLLSTLSPFCVQLSSLLSALSILLSFIFPSLFNIEMHPFLSFLVTWRSAPRIPSPSSR
jgi:hypothetical protein